MKQRVVAKTPEKMPVLRDGSAPDAMLGRLQKITAEIHTVQSELYHALAEEDGTPKKHFGSLSSAGDDLSAFKSAVDQLRRVLWFYLENVATSQTADADAASAKRLQESVEMLHKLTPQAPSSGAASVSFFDRLNVVIEGYMLHNRVRTKADR